MDKFGLLAAGIGAALFLAIIWLSYLIKLVVVDELMQERIRQIRRRHEEQLRAEEDKRKKKLQAQEEIDAGVAKVLSGPASPDAKLEPSEEPTEA